MNDSDLTKGHDRPSWWWLAVLLLVLCLVAADSVRRMHYVLACTHNTMGWPLLLPEPDETSPTGYALGQRRLFLPSGGFDGYHYLMQTEKRLETGAWRTRHVDYDNYPDTREMHWASLLSWILEAAARCDRWLTGHSMGIALERVAPYAHTLFFVVALVIIIPLTARRLSSAAASVLALGLIFMPQIYEFNLVGNLDHHGIVCIFGMLTLLCLIAGGAGWVRDESPEAMASALARWLPDAAGARRWFAASAVAGGAAMWVSCATQIPVFVGLALGMLCGTIGSATPGGPWHYEPKLWRWWSRVGAATSFFFYLVEYFPSEMNVRLEVNHPFYALAWLGGGEVLYQLARFAQLGRQWCSAPSLFGLGLALAALMPVPVVMRVWPETFSMQDRFMQILTSHYVSEGHSLYLIMMGDTLLNNWVLVTCLPLLGLLQLALLIRGKLSRPLQSLLWLTLVPCLLMSLLTLLQVRWLGVAQLLWLANLTVSIWLLKQIGMLATTIQKMSLLVFLAAAFVPGIRFMAFGLFEFGCEYYSGSTETVSQSFDLNHLGMRDMAFRLRSRVGHETTCVLAGATDTTALIYHGDHKGLGTLYWENVAGLKAASAIYGAPSPAKAFELIQYHKIKYLVLFSYFHPVDQNVRLHLLLTPEEELPRETFGLQLAKDVHPWWLRPIDIPIPNHEAFGDRKATVYEVVTEESRKK